MLHCSCKLASLLIVLVRLFYDLHAFMILHAETVDRPASVPELLYLILPLGLFASQELVQNSDVLLQSLQPLIQFLVHTWLVISQLGIEVLSVGCSRHGGGEDGLDDEGVVRLKSLAVGFTEGGGEFFGGSVNVSAEGLGGEVETSIIHS